ncbi:hypothetical protein [Paenibacillus sp. 1P03SA]|uniref:hypothetical protein n=1 Tax=Paenibacillus sp. 1P03SA TaxID=3132294 RepID=UPI0039A1D7E5
MKAGRRERYGGLLAAALGRRADSSRWRIRLGRRAGSSRWRIRRSAAEPAASAGASGAWLQSRQLPLAHPALGRRAGSFRWRIRRSACPLHMTQPPLFLPYENRRRVTF